ncbi:MAG: shikimate kinase [Desulfuromonas sp.]|jgi:shikimate kinase|nr:shikimate kinase [Desulfuromonas sp.]
MTRKYIFLTGFMAAGKSTVGRVLAHMLDGQFIDTDAIIEHRLCMSIKAIFAHFGEEYFRSCETAVLYDLCSVENIKCDRASSSATSNNIVISTGGGMVGRVQNREIMHKHGTVVYLHAPWTEISKRLHGVSNRPLAHNVEAESLHRLWQRRLPLYKKADIIIETAHCDPRTIAQNIVRRIII